MKRKGLFFLAGISFLCVPVLPTRLASCQSFPLENKTYLRSEPAGITINGKKIRHRLGTGFDSNQNTVYLSVRFLTSHLFFFFFHFAKGPTQFWVLPCLPTYSAIDYVDIVWWRYLCGWWWYRSPRGPPTSSTFFPPSKFALTKVILSHCATFMYLHINSLDKQVYIN